MRAASSGFGSVPWRRCCTMHCKNGFSAVGPIGRRLPRNQLFGKTMLLVARFAGRLRAAPSQQPRAQLVQAVAELRGIVVWRAAALCGVAAFLQVPAIVCAQAGPPFLTNDPGTPGAANWEINIGSMQTVTRTGANYQVPQLDLNFGIGDTIQLTYEIPFVLETAAGRPTQSGWGNGYPGIKWRFLDQGRTAGRCQFFLRLKPGCRDRRRRAESAGQGRAIYRPWSSRRESGRSMSILKPATI